MKDDRVYLRYILERIRRVEEDTAGGKEGIPRPLTVSGQALTLRSTPRLRRDRRLTEGEAAVVGRDDAVE
jgi:hypothetical protein